MFTPPELARQLAAGLRSPPGAALLDPACGQGELLLGALAAGAAPSRLHGLERSEASARLARERLAAASGPGLEVSIAPVDALAAETVWPSGTWILANPPWASFSGRASVRSRLAAPPESHGGWPSLQGAFLERIARHVSREGTGARVIVPASLTETQAYAPLRAAVTSQARVVAVEELGEDAFPGVVAPAVILDLEPGGAASPGAWRGARDDGLEHALAHLPRLPASTFADPGVHSGNAARELVVRGPAEDRSGLPGVREGRCLAAYDLGAPQAGLRVDLRPSDGLRFRVHEASHYSDFPVLLRQTAPRPIAALHVEPTYFRNSLLAARAVPGLEPEFLVAVLNGPLAGAWHRDRFRDARQRAFPQVKVGHLRTQPFPIVHRDQAPALHDEVVRRVRALRPGSAEFDTAVRELDRRILAAFDLPTGLAQRVTRTAAP